MIGAKWIEFYPSFSRVAFLSILNLGGFYPRQTKVNMFE